MRRIQPQNYSGFGCFAWNWARLGASTGEAYTPAITRTARRSKRRVAVTAKKLRWRSDPLLTRICRLLINLSIMNLN